MAGYRSRARGMQLPGPPPRLLLCKGDAAEPTVHAFPPSGCSGARMLRGRVLGLWLKLQYTEEKGTKVETWKGGRERDEEMLEGERE